MATPTSDQLVPQTLNPNQLRQLANIKGEPCISLVMPTKISGKETRQGSIRLKNLLSKVEQQVDKRNQAANTLAEVRELIDSEEFWQHQGEGLAIFVTPEQVRTCRLSHSVQEGIMIGSQPYLKPIIPSLANFANFALLALTWDDARLYRTENERLKTVETEQLPTSFEALITARDPEVQLQYTSHQSAGKNAATPMYHGQGEGEGKIHADRRQYLGRVGELISQELYESNLPLVLVATEEVAGHFQALTELKLDGVIHGSPGDFELTKLHAAAREKLTAKNRFDLSQFGDRLGSAQALGQASTNLQEIVLAAQQGRIDTIVADMDHEVWGLIDLEKNEVTITEADPHSIELVNQAIVSTVQQGGNAQVLVNRSAEIFSHPVAAIYRY